MRCVAGILLVMALTACTGRHADQDNPRQAGQGMDPARVTAQMAAIEAAALTGDQEALKRNVEAMNDDFRRAIKLPDGTRRVDPEAARAAARKVEGVRSVVWLDRENLFVIVDRNELRSYATIDRICKALEPLGDTLGVMVNLQSGAATTGDELEILSRNCQLAPGDRALLSRPRQIDVISPEIRAQHKANQALAEDEELSARQEEALRIIEQTTPEPGKHRPD
jgi:hypothetical protein